VGLGGDWKGRVRVEWIGVSTFSTFVWDGAIAGHMACWEVETEKRLYRGREEVGGRGYWG
jgi:hypothetical protein